MSDLYENLLKATSNIDDITTEKYATITKLNGNYCDAKEEDTGLEHTNVPIINGANLSVGDKAIIGFINNSIYDVVCYGALDKQIHDDSKQDTLISGTNIKTINHQSLLGSGNITIGGGGSSVDIATSWGNPTSDSKVPSEKLTKSSLDSKIDKSQTVGLVKNDGTIDTTTYVNTNDSRLSDARTPLSHTHTSSQVTDLIDVIYPVGSIYMSVNSTSPQTLFGGTWEQIKDTFLLSSGDTYSNGATGGSADATLVSHNHTTRETGEYFVTSENSDSNNTRVAYNSSGNRYVDGMTSGSTPFHHRTATGYEGSSGTGKNMPPYLVVNIWKRTA